MTCSIQYRAGIASLLFAMSAGCGEGAGDPAAGFAADAGASTATPPTSLPGGPVTSVPGLSSPPLTPDAGAIAPGEAGAATGESGARSGLPCAIQRVVDAKCNACHSDPPVGTFMPLTTHAHWHAQGTRDKTKQYWELALSHVSTGVMPPPAAPSGALTGDEKAALLDWLQRGAPASSDTCAPTAAADAGAPTATNSTEGLDCYRFLAHAPGDKKAKFEVGAAVDKYYNFGFKAPWTSTVYGIVVRPVIDNAKVLHHWLIYREAIGDGVVEETIGQHGNGELIHGWAPGGVAMDFRKHGDVGFELPATSYSVEFHYNSDDPSALDASGVELCVQRTPPKNLASMSWLGYDHGGTLSYATGICFDPAAQWSGTCKPVAKEPIHMIFLTPHLHQAGRHLRSVIKGVDGKERVLHDKPFDFAYQVTYETDEVLMPGETITTSCTFSEPKCAGQATSQEMCYLFTYAWPKHALVDNGPEGTFMHGEGVCLGQ